MIWKDVGFEKGLGEGKLGPNDEVLDFLWVLVRKGRDVQGNDRLKFPYAVFRRRYEWLYVQLCWLFGLVYASFESEMLDSSRWPYWY